MRTDLWSSKALELVWFPTSPLWHSPMIHKGRFNAWNWYYRIDVSFVAWATRTLHRARQAGAYIPGDPEKSLKVIRSYIEELQPGSLVTVDTLAQSPVRLAGDEVILDATEFARWGWVPRVS